MSEAVFRIEYAGPALEDGSMDVRDLAPALLGLGDACTRANNILNHGACKVEVRVNANFESGSFDVLLTLLSIPADQAVIDHISDAKQILDLLGIGSTGVIGVFKLIKYLKGKRPDQVKKIDNGHIEVKIENNTYIIDNRTYEIARNPEIRDSLQKAVAPLNKAGIDEMRILASDSTTAIESIKKEEVGYFARPKEEWSFDNEEVYTGTNTVPFEIVQLPFEDDLVWRLRELGESRHRFSARMVDERFITEVREGVHSFTCGDVIVVDLCTETRIGPVGTSINRTITHVHKLIKRPKKSDFPELPLPPDIKKQKP